MIAYCASTAEVCGNYDKWYCDADDKCIPENWRCDIVPNDCSNNADEEECTGKVNDRKITTLLQQNEK